MKILRSLSLPALVILLVAVVGCRSTYYAAYEKFGVYKRDLLKKRVVAARDEQKEIGRASCRERVCLAG